MKKITTLLRTISVHPSENYITLGDLAICWGYSNIPNIAQNALTTLTPLFPITFKAAPIVVPFFATGMGAGRNMLIQAPASAQTASSASIIVVNNGIAFGAATNGCGWVAIGFLGGGSS